MIGDVSPVVRQATETDGPAAAVDAFFAALCPGLWARIDEPVKDRYRDNASMLFADLGMPRYAITADDIAGIDAPFLELDCGHVTYAEQPAEFARAVAAFAGELVTAVAR